MGYGQDGEIYVVARGLTAIAVAGTEPETGVVIRHPGSTRVSREAGLD